MRLLNKVFGEGSLREENVVLLKTIIVWPPRPMLTRSVHPLMISPCKYWDQSLIPTFAWRLICEIFSLIIFLNFVTTSQVCLRLGLRPDLRPVAAGEGSRRGHEDAAGGAADLVDFKAVAGGRATHRVF